MKNIGNVDDIVYLKDVLKRAIAFKRKWDQRKLTHFEKLFGICSNTALSALSSDVVAYINKHYVHYSGNFTYPVDHPEYGPSYAYHMLKGDGYDRRTVYGRNRYQYLLTVIAVLSELIHSHSGESNENSHCRWT